VPFLCYLQKLHFGRYAFRKGVADAKAFWFIPLYQPFLIGRASYASEGLFSPATAKALATQTFAAERVLRAKAAFAAAKTCPLMQGEGRRNTLATALVNSTHGRHARTAADYIITVM